MRKGYVLTEDAQAERNDFTSEYGHGGNCSCFTGCAPCASCTHPGNPPPPGYEAATTGQKRKPGYLWKPRPNSAWESGYKENEGLTIESFAFVANPVESGDVQKKLDLQWEAAKALEQERNELQKKVEELSAKVALLTETNTSLCEKIKSLEDSFTEAGTLSVGKAGISVSIGDHVLLTRKATHTLYIREVKQ